jgi:hypothetical protein
VQRSVCVDRGVDRPQVLCDLLVVAARHVAEAVADQVHDAGLHRRGREDRLARFGESLEPVDAGDQDVVDAALLEVGEDLHPELRALVGLEPHAEDFALAVHPDRHRQIAGASLHAAAVTDLQHHAVEEHDRVDVLQRPGLPGAGVVHDRVGHAADQIPPDFDAVDVGEVRFDVPRGEPTGIEGEDLLVEPLEPPLALSDDLRLEAAVAVPRSVATGPCSVISVFGVLPLRALPAPPGGSRCGSYPRWSVRSTSIARSTSRFVNCESSPPGPTISSSLRAPASSSSTTPSGRSSRISRGRSPTPGGLSTSRPPAFRCARPTRHENVGGELSGPGHSFG